MTKTALLTLGRLPKALDIVESLSKAGFRVVVAEPFNWHLCRVSRHVAKSVKVTAPNENQRAYLDDLLSIIEEEKVSLVVPVSEEALHATLIGDRLPEGTRLFSLSQERLCELHDKLRFCRLAQSLNLPVPITHELGTSEAAQFAADNDFILKPNATCSGQGFEMFKAGDALPPMQNMTPMVVQQKMTGALKSTFSIAHNGRLIGTIVYRAKVLSGTVAVAFERLTHERAIEDWVQSFVEATQHTGFICFDMMEDESGIPHAIECNPRATSGIHFVDRDDLAGAMIDPAAQIALRPRPYALMQQFFPCLTETQMALFRRDSFLEKLTALIKAKDVNFSWSDPLPFWLQPFTSWEIIKRSMFNGESFGEASTFDIGWYGEQRVRSGYAHEDIPQSL